MTFVFYVLTFLLGVFVGSLIVYFRYEAQNVGKIVVYKEEEKTRFMLELDEDPEEIELAKAVRFKIVPSE